MRSPFWILRARRGWTRRQLAKALGIRPRVISDIEEGKKRIPAKIYRPLSLIGENAFDLAIQQEAFIKWRRDFHQSLYWGERPAEDLRSNQWPMSF